MDAQVRAAELWQVPQASFSRLLQVSLSLGTTDGLLSPWKGTLETSPGPVHKALLSACPAGLRTLFHWFPLNYVFFSSSLNFHATPLLSLIS